MVYLVSAVAAFGVAFVTLFTGFGLGTLLMPVLALFFPVTVAVAATGVVHGLNNIFKVSLLWPHIRWDIVLRFGVPAVLAAFVGAWTLTRLSTGEPLAVWSAMGRDFEITPVKLTIGALIAVFALIELSPGMKKLSAPASMLPVGGLISGFFGGLSGHQGALRTVFILPLGLRPEPFAATQSAIGTLVDLARVAVYSVLIFSQPTALGVPWAVVALATLCAFAGSFIGRRLLTKVTVSGIQIVAGILLLGVSVALMAGII